MSEMIVKFHCDERGIARSWDEVGKLIRCKDCKHHHYQDEIPYCDMQDYGYGWKDEDYCSWAERRSK